MHNNGIALVKDDSPEVLIGDEVMDICMEGGAYEILWNGKENWILPSLASRIPP